MEPTTPKTAIRIQYFNTYYALLEDGRLLRCHADAWARATSVEEYMLRTQLAHALCGDVSFPDLRRLCLEGWQQYEVFDHHGERQLLRGETEKLDFAQWLQAALAAWRTANPGPRGPVRAIVVDTNEPGAARLHS